LRDWIEAVSRFPGLVDGGRFILSFSLALRAEDEAPPFLKTKCFLAEL